VSNEGQARRHALRALFHAGNYLHLDVGRSGAAEQIVAALTAARHDDLPEVRIAAAWPLALMRHEVAWQRQPCYHMPPVCNGKRLYVKLRAGRQNNRHRTRRSQATDGPILQDRAFLRTPPASHLQLSTFNLQLSTFNLQPSTLQTFQT
jgi:hypothetical protein